MEGEGIEKVPTKPVSAVTLLEKEQYCDVTFVVGSKIEKVPCHQMFLKANSPVFDVMLSDRWAQSKAKSSGEGQCGDDQQDLEIQLPDVEASVFRIFLKFIYGVSNWETNIPPTTIVYVLAFAQQYQVVPLVNACTKLLEQSKLFPSLDNVIELYQIARFHRLDSVQKNAGDCLSTMFSALMRHSSFNETMDEQTLLDMLKLDDLEVDELMLFNALLGWSSAQHQQDLVENGLTETNPSASKQRQVLERILPLVRFPTMPISVLKQEVIPKGILTDAEIHMIFHLRNYECIPRKRKRNSKDDVTKLDFNPISRKKFAWVGLTLSILEKARAYFRIAENSSGSDSDCAVKRTMWVRTSRDLILFRVGFLGPIESDSLFHVELKVIRDRFEGCYGTMKKRVYAKKQEIFHLNFDEPIVIKSGLTESNVGDWYRLEYTVEGPSTQLMTPFKPDPTGKTVTTVSCGSNAKDPIRVGLKPEGEQPQQLVELLYAET